MFLLLGLLIAATAFVHISTTELAAPRRRAVQGYHREWLEHPATHGIKIKHHLCLGSKVPCLVVEPDPQSEPAKRGKLIRDQLVAENVPIPDFGKVNAQLVILHGRAGRKEDVLSVAERFCAVGFRCIVPDLPGHGESKVPYPAFGSNEFESDMVERIVAETGGAEYKRDLPCAILGISMGGAYAVKAAQQADRWYSMAVVCSFDRLESVIEGQCQKRAGLFGPVLKRSIEKKAQKMTGLSVGKVRPVDWAGEIDIPVVVVHGIDDALIPMHHGRELFRGFKSIDKKWVEVPAAGHNNVLTTPMQVYAAMAEWLIFHQPDE